MVRLTCLVLLVLLPALAHSQIRGYERFEQLGTLLPTPNRYRSGSGAPGPDYWQQRADYDIEVSLDDRARRITGRETITYHNNSPDALDYLWLQLDQNLFDKNSDTYLTESERLDERESFDAFFQRLAKRSFEGGLRIEYVRDARGRDLPFTAVKTMMRVDLPQPLQPGQVYVFSIGWNFLVNEHKTLGGRCGYEYFESDGNNLYEIAQWFPRMAVYNDYQGWNHKQFLGRGEFALTFGDYRVRITVPADFVVAATGELQNEAQVLTATQRNRLAQARRTTDRPVLIITEAEAKENAASRRNDSRTWEYRAQMVRDFAWAASRKFIWDAMSVPMGGRNVLAMSYYPPEGNPLWEKYSTQAVAHTLRVYSRYTFDYPYPVAISVNGPVFGMEYPMICFNGPRPEPDGTYSEGTKRGLVSVVIHEVGHNYFPMIVNSDERQWTWLDEGLNSFVQFLAEQEWSRDYYPRRGPAVSIVDYMKGAKSTQEPIMTNSESITQFGNNAYGKPAAALNILRETILGRELFDHAFKTYAQRWMFKHPTPADFFRTLEDASGVDLDWFWRGWFYTTDHVDIQIESIRQFEVSTQNPDIENERTRRQQAAEPQSIHTIRNRTAIPRTLIDEKPELIDFYDRYDPLEVTSLDRRQYERLLQSLDDRQRAALRSGLRLCEVSFRNLGGLPMPLILKFTFSDGSTYEERIPAEIWRRNAERVSRVFVFEKDVQSLELDPYLETADTDRSNNYFPPQVQPSRLELFKQRERDRLNPMQIQQRMDELQNR